MHAIRRSCSEAQRKNSFPLDPRRPFSHSIPVRPADRDGRSNGLPEELVARMERFARSFAAKFCFGRFEMEEESLVQIVSVSLQMFLCVYIIYTTCIYIYILSYYIYICCNYSFLEDLGGQWKFQPFADRSGGSLVKGLLEIVRQSN